MFQKTKPYRLIHGESVVNPRGQRDQVSLGHGDSDPVIVFVSDIKVRSSIQDVTDLIVEVQVFLVEHF